MRSIRFRTLGCYPLTGAIESEAATLPASGAGNAADHHQRAPGPRDRQRRRRREHGEEEAGGLFLMADADASGVRLPGRRPHRRGHRGLSRAAPAQGAAALHHLRQRRRRQVDADRAAAVRFEDDLRGPARRARGRQQARRHAGPGDRFRAARRRPRRRARAGHHDRRRLSLLLDREAQVHRRRHARGTSSTRATWSPARRPPTWR